MNRFCKLVLVGALAVVSCLVSSAQNDYRSKGYKGSVSITDQFGVWLGAETSHGYMFNRNIYLGAGIGGYIFPDGTDNPYFGEAFLDFHSYLKDKKGTPVLGLKTGLMHGFNYENASGMKLKNGFFFEPNPENAVYAQTFVRLRILILFGKHLIANVLCKTRSLISYAFFVIV